MLPVIHILDTKEPQSTEDLYFENKTKIKTREIFEITGEQEKKTHKGAGVPFHITSFENFSALKCLGISSQVSPSVS